MRFLRDRVSHRDLDRPASCGWSSWPRWLAIPTPGSRSGLGVTFVRQSPIPPVPSGTHRNL